MIKACSVSATCALPSTRIPSYRVILSALNGHALFPLCQQTLQLHRQVALLRAELRQTLPIRTVMCLNSCLYHGDFRLEVANLLLDDAGFPTLARTRTG